VNRIQAAIQKMADQIQERINLGMTTEARVEATRKSLDMGMEEFVRFQELKSLAVIENKMTLDEGQLLYSLLGETPEHFNKQGAATKAVLTQIFQELLSSRIAASKAAQARPQGWDHV
jgi:hypothetical protein